MTNQISRNVEVRSHTKTLSTEHFVKRTGNIQFVILNGSLSFNIKSVTHSIRHFNLQKISFKENNFPCEN